MNQQGSLPTRTKPGQCIIAPGMATTEQADQELAQLLHHGAGQTRQQLYHAAASTAARTGSLATLRLLEGSAGQAGAEGPATEPASAAAAKDAAAAGLHATKEGDAADAAAALRHWPQLRALVATAWWDATADTAPAGSFVAQALALMRALQPLAKEGAQGGNAFCRLLGVLTAELAFHAEAAQLVMQPPSSQEEPSSSSNEEQAGAEGGQAFATPKGLLAASGEQPGAQQEAAAAEVLRRLRAGEPAAQVLAELAPESALQACRPGCAAIGQRTCSWRARRARKPASSCCSLQAHCWRAQPSRVPWCRVLRASRAWLWKT